MEIGAQFYTLRDFCTTPEDFSESLKKVADIGYKNVQISGTCAFEPEWLKQQLAQNGLSCVVTHTSADKMIADAKAVAQEHEIFGCPYVGLGYFAFDEKTEAECYENFVATFKNIAAVLKENGKYFMYHNHDQEFRKIGNKLIIEKMAEDFSADEMGFTLDTFWVQAGGGDPAQWIEKLSGRVPCIHLKDFAFGRKMAVIGEGNINFDRVFQKAEQAGTKYMLVEQDICNGENPFNCLRRSYQNLHALGFK